MTNKIRQYFKEKIIEYHHRDKLVKSDYPTPKDFYLVRRNLNRCLKLQEEFWKWKKKQPELKLRYNWGVL